MPDWQVLKSMYDYSMSHITDRLTDKIEIRLQFVAVILVFFLTVFEKSLFAGCIIVALYVVDYIFFVSVAERLQEKILKWVNISTLVGIGSFVIPLTMIALSTHGGNIPVWEAYTWMGSSLVSIVCMFIAPLALLILLGIYGINWRRMFH